MPFHPPGDLPDPGIELGSPTLQTDALPSEPAGKLHILMYIQGEFPLGLSDLISVLRDWPVSSPESNISSLKASILQHSAFFYGPAHIHI